VKGDILGKNTVDFIRDDVVSILMELQHIRKLLEDIEKNTRPKTP